MTKQEDLYEIYRNPDPRCEYPFEPWPFGYCWSYAKHVDGAQGYKDISRICQNCKYRQESMTQGQKERAIRHFRWMIEKEIWRHYESGGIENNYSPELQDAINLLKELEEDTADLTELEKAERKAKTTGNREDTAEYMRLRRERKCFTE